MLPSQANFLLARRRGCDQEGLYSSLKERGILVRYFPIPELRDSLRITIGTNEEIDKLLTALAEIEGAGSGS